MAKINRVDFDEVWQNCIEKRSIELDTMTNNHYSQQQQQQQLTDDDNNEKNAFTSELTAIEDDNNKKAELIGSKPLVTALRDDSKKASISAAPRKTESALNLLTSRILRFIMGIQIFTW